MPEAVRRVDLLARTPCLSLASPGQRWGGKDYSPCLFMRTRVSITKADETPPWCKATPAPCVWDTLLV